MDESTKKELIELKAELYAAVMDCHKKALTRSDSYIVGRLDGAKDAYVRAYNRLKGILDRYSP